MASNRHLGRIIALQTLYEYEFRVQCDDKSVSVDEILQRNFARYDDMIGDKVFVEKLVQGVLKDTGTLDDIIQPIAPEWPIAQIARVDRAILRIAVYEMTAKEATPPKVIINEAVELAKAFGSDNSSKFVNGVLGTAYRTLHGDDTNASTKA